MHVQVELQFVRLSERLAAVLTDARLLLGVRAPHVTIVGGVRGERFAAVAALERLLAAVLAHVRAQYGRGRERLDAVGALVRTLPTVDPQVFIETGRLREAFSALGALVRTMFLMHVKDMYAKSVSFLERAIAEVARELPVALVHATRVLEMLVSVVFIGEHFTATIAGITVTI